MNRPLWTTIAAACMLAGSAGAVVSQERSTTSGVFTTEQALRGKDVYAAMCRTCHSSPTHTPAFKSAWAGRPLGELFEFITWNMPKDNPGTLTPEENTVVLAYMLQMLGMPAGSEALASDPATLGRIRFDTLATQETKP